jgi:hypothetical protein
VSVCFRAKYTKAEITILEELIIKYIVSLIKDAHQTPNILQYSFEYGIIDWAWPLRFVKGNEQFKGFKYYSLDAYNAVVAGEKKFTRDHYFPKIILKKMLLNLNNPDPVSVRRIMETYGDVCVITRDENKRLAEAGLNTQMPEGWQIGNNVFARYEAIGIKVWVNNRQWQ